MAAFAWKSARAVSKDPIPDWPDGSRAPMTGAWDGNSDPTLLTEAGTENQEFETSEILFASL